MPSITPEEAENMKCPRLLDTLDEGTCIGTRCMAWRWVSHPLAQKKPSIHIDRPFADPIIARGYCGLVGEPKVGLDKYGR